MVDMMSKKEGNIMQDVSIKRDKYPNGLCLSLNKEEINKIPMLKDVKVGDRVSINASGCVTRCICDTVINDGKEELEHSVSLQIEKMGITPEKKKKPEDASLKEYRAIRGLKKE